MGQACTVTTVTPRLLLRCYPQRYHSLWFLASPGSASPSVCGQGARARPPPPLPEGRAQQCCFVLSVHVALNFYVIEMANSQHRMFTPRMLDNVRQKPEKDRCGTYPLHSGRRTRVHPRPL